MTLEKALKSVQATGCSLLLRCGPYVFSHRNGEFFDSKNRKVTLTDDERNSDKWEIENDTRWNEPAWS